MRRNASLPSPLLSPSAAGHRPPTPAAAGHDGDGQFQRWEGRSAPAAIPNPKGRGFPSPRGPLPQGRCRRGPPPGSVPARRLHPRSLTAGRDPSPGRASPTPPRVGLTSPHAAPATLGPAAAAASPSNSPRPLRACALAALPVPGRAGRWRRPVRRRRRRTGNIHPTTTPAPSLVPVPRTTIPAGPPDPHPVPAGCCRRRWRCWSPSTWRSCGWRGAAAGRDRSPHFPPLSAPGSAWSGPAPRRPPPSPGPAPQVGALGDQHHPAPRHGPGPGLPVRPIHPAALRAPPGRLSDPAPPFLPAPGLFAFLVLWVFCFVLFFFFFS